MRLPEVQMLKPLWRTGGLISFQFIPPDVAQRVAAEFPPPDDPRWHTFSGDLEGGKQEGQAGIAGPLVTEIHDVLASDEWLAWLRTLTGIPLWPDPDRTGGGIHQSGPGARLAMHADFNVHPGAPEWVRAVNVILFLDDGPIDYRQGGWFEFQHVGVTDGIAGQRLRPKPGLLALFAANDVAYHGHPVPIAAGGALRRSIPAYFYRKIREGEMVEAHSTRFLAEA